MEIKVSIVNEGIEIPRALVEAAGGDPLVARIFYNRGYREPETVRQMLHEELYTPAKTGDFPQMQKAVEVISHALEQGEQIAVYGDYDVDGVTSTALLVQCLRSFSAGVVYHVPDRFTEGYGMNSDVIREMARKGVSLVITCDCGISNQNEIQLAKELGMEVVITDHHNLPEVLPPAAAILNPKLLAEGHPARNLSGCAMAYFVALALLEKYGREKQGEDYLDLVAMSLIADVVSLNGENRYLLKKALPALFQTQRVGLRALFRLIEKNSKLQTEEDVAFQVAPRLNAAGRLDSARLPVELLLGTVPAGVEEMAEKIDFLNSQRKRIQQEIIDQALAMVEEKKKNKTILVLFHEYWHHGILGIAAGKVCEKYRKPAILLSMKEDGKTVVGSARSTEEVDIHALIRDCSSRLSKFGGHTAAAGLSLHRENLDAFISEIEIAAESKYYFKDSLQVQVDAKLHFQEVNEELLQRITSAGPYGEGFEAPVFLTPGVTVVSDRKTEKLHHIMVLAGGQDLQLPAVQWFGEDRDLLGRQFDIAYKVGRNTYRGKNELQLTVEHFLETGGIPVRTFSGTLLDRRNGRIDEFLDPARSTVVFYEGLEGACPVRGACDRYGLHPAENLVFLGTPVNTLVFREVISLVNPRQVIIHFAVLSDYSMKGFLSSLMGLVKYVVGRQGGKAALESLALRMNAEEAVILAALKYLAAAGMIRFAQEESDVFLIPERGSPQGDLKRQERNLAGALAEKHAYQQFILQLEIEKFAEYLK